MMSGEEHPTFSLPQPLGSCPDPSLTAEVDRQESLGFGVLRLASWGTKQHREGEVKDGGIDGNRQIISGPQFLHLESEDNVTFRLWWLRGVPLGKDCNPWHIVSAQCKVAIGGVQPQGRHRACGDCRGWGFWKEMTCVELRALVRLRSVTHGD